MKYKITGRLYGEIATFHSWDHDKKYPMFKVVSEKNLGDLCRYYERSQKMACGKLSGILHGMQYKIDWFQ